jgi:ketosteroid isomerase-like protein
MSDADIAINEIKALEDRRYRAMIDGDTAVLDELCSDDLIYTHSKGDHDDKRAISTRSTPATSLTSRSRIQRTAS